MDLAINRVRLLYAVGVALGIAAVFYFGFQLLEDLSPTTTAALLLLGFLLFGLAGLSATTETLDTVFYALAAGAYLVFLAYTTSRFDLAETEVFLLLAVSSGLFIGLGYLSHRQRLQLTTRHARVGMLLVVVLSVLLIAGDVIGAQPSYTADFEDSIDVPPPRTDVRVGTVTATNEYVLSRTIEPPRYHACLYTPEFYPIPLLRYSDSPQMVLGGGESRTFDLVIGSGAFYEGDTLRGDLRNRTTIPIESRQACPEQSDTVRLVVAPNEFRPPR